MMNVHKFNNIIYYEMWPNNKPKNLVSRTHELTISNNNNNKWIDHLITISLDGNNNERWVEIDFKNGVFYFNKNKISFNCDCYYVGKYEYNSDDIYWYRNMYDLKYDKNMIFKWVQHKKIVSIPKHRLISQQQQPTKKSLKNNIEQPVFNYMSDFPALNLIKHKKK